MLLNSVVTSCDFIVHCSSFNPSEVTSVPGFLLLTVSCAVNLVICASVNRHKRVGKWEFFISKFRVRFVTTISFMSGWVMQNCDSRSN